MKNLIGKFNTLYELWKQFPNGGSEDDIVIVDGVEMMWSKILDNWTRIIKLNPSRKNEEINGDLIVRDNLHVAGKIYAYDEDLPHKGLFESKERLELKYPKGKKGDWAIVGKTNPFNIWKWECNSGWCDTGETADIHIDADAFIGREEFSKLLGDGYIFVGMIEPSSSAPTFVNQKFGIAVHKGTYTNFGGIVKAENGITILKCSKEGVWSADNAFNIFPKSGNSKVDTMSQSAITELANEGYIYGGLVKVGDSVAEPTRNTYYLVTEKGTYDNLGGVVIESEGAYFVKCKITYGKKAYTADRVVMFDDENSNYTTRTMSQKGIHELVKNKTERYDFRGIIEVAVEDIIKESYEGEGGAVLYNKTNNKFIVRVQNDGTTLYYESASKFPIAGTSPISGRFYQTDSYGGNKLYVGYNDGLARLALPLGNSGEDTELPMSQKAATDFVGASINDAKKYLLKFATGINLSNVKQGFPFTLASALVALRGLLEGFSITIPIGYELCFLNTDGAAEKYIFNGVQAYDESSWKKVEYTFTEYLN